MFSVVTSSSIRFPVEPFCLSYEVMYHNPDYVVKPPTGNDGRTEAQRVLWHFTKAQEKLPSVYLESALGGASFFSKIEVEVNGYPISDVSGPSLGNHGWFYAIFNKVFCTEKLRMDKYDRNIPRVSTETDRKPATGNAASPRDLHESAESLEFDAETVSKPKMSVFGFDGESCVAL